MNTSYIPQTICNGGAIVLPNNLPLLSFPKKYSSARIMEECPNNFFTNTHTHTHICIKDKVKKKNNFLRASEAVKIFNLKQYKMGSQISLA